MLMNVSLSYQTLDNFYHEKENLEAFVSIQSYIDNPAGDVLFILGPPSSGKTHLLCGVVNKLSSIVGLKVTMLTSESLKNRLVVAIQDNTIAEFWDDLLDVDVLIVDDCQFLSYGIDDVIVQLSEIYQRKNKRLILAGDYLLDSLRAIPNIRILKLLRPSYDTRLRIIQEIADEKGYALNKKQINLIAEKTNDPRRIRGILSWIYAHQNEGDLLIERDNHSTQTLKAEIASQYKRLTHIGHRNPSYILARALVKLGIAQSKVKADGRGWTCGNHTKAVCIRVEAKLEKEYAKEELNNLILYCVSGAGDVHYEAMLCDLTKRIPAVYVNGLLHQNIK